MMVRIIIFNVILFGSCFYAFIKGGRDARLVALTTLIATHATLFGMRAYDSIESVVLVIDLLVLLVFVAVALRSDRFWPLWISGLQLLSTVGHLLKAFQADLAPIVYAISIRAWSYPIQIILAVAVWRSVRRQREVQDLTAHSA